MAALARLIGEGFEVQANGGKILISPATRLTDGTRQWIRQHKAELLAELQHREAANQSKPHLYLFFLDSGQVIQRFSPDSLVQIQERAQVEYGVSLLKVVAVRFLTDEALPKALAGACSQSVEGNE